MASGVNYQEMIEFHPDCWLDEDDKSPL